MSLEPIDQANVQRLVNVISEKTQRLDKDEHDLEKVLLDFTEFFAIPTPMEEDGKPIPVPYQFQLENHIKFKKLTIPISRSIWAFTKVVSHMRQELYAHEVPLPNLSNALPTMGDNSGETKSFMNSFKDLTKKLYRDPHSPYNATKDQMDYLSNIPGQWINMVHIFELNIRNRPRINTRRELDRIMNDLVIVFNSHIEPNLLSVVHYANLILKGEADDRVVNLLTAYRDAEERKAKLLMGMGQYPQNPQM